MRRLCTALLLLTAPLASASDSATFHGWSKDGSWFAYQTTSGPNELTELFFCSSEKDVQPSWPKDLDALEPVDGRIRCVRYTDPNRAPYGWKAQLQLPKPSPGGPNGMRVDKELSYDVERPGYVVELGGKKVTCYVSGLREDSRLGSVYWHPNGRFVAAFVDGVFSHCDVPLKPGPPARPPPKKKKGK